MIQVTLNLENEHVLKDNLNALFDSMSTEQIQEVAQKALFKYLTDAIDYEKEIYISEKIAESRENGIKNSSSWHSKTVKELEPLSDDAIKRLDAFKEKYLNNYKSNKESRLNQINEILDKEITNKAKEFVSSNKDLAKLVVKKQEAIAENFETIVKDTLLSVVTNLIYGTINNAYIGASNINQTQIITDVLTKNNLY